MLIKLTYKNVRFVNWKTAWIVKITLYAENVTMGIFWINQIIMKNVSSVLTVVKLVSQNQLFVSAVKMDFI